MKLAYDQHRVLAGMTPEAKLVVRGKGGQSPQADLDAMDKDRSIQVYPGAAPTHPCPYGPPLPDLPSNFLLAAPTAFGKDDEHLKPHPALL